MVHSTFPNNCPAEGADHVIETHHGVEDTALSRSACFHPQDEILSDGTNTQSEAATF